VEVVQKGGAEDVRELRAHNRVSLARVNHAFEGIGARIVISKIIDGNKAIDAIVGVDVVVHAGESLVVVHRISRGDRQIGPRRS